MITISPSSITPFHALIGGLIIFNPFSHIVAGYSYPPGTREFSHSQLFSNSILYYRSIFYTISAYRCQVPMEEKKNVLEHIGTATKEGDFGKPQFSILFKMSSYFLKPGNPFPKKIQLPGIYLEYKLPGNLWWHKMYEKNNKYKIDRYQGGNK